MHHRKVQWANVPLLPKIDPESMLAHPTSSKKGASVSGFHNPNDQTNGWLLRGVRQLHVQSLEQVGVIDLHRHRPAGVT